MQLIDWPSRSGQLSASLNQKVVEKKKKKKKKKGDVWDEEILLISNLAPFDDLWQPRQLNGKRKKITSLFSDLGPPTQFSVKRKKILLPIPGITKIKMNENVY